MSNKILAEGLDVGSCSVMSDVGIHKWEIVHRSHDNLNDELLARCLPAVRLQRDTKALRKWTGDADVCQYIQGHQLLPVSLPFLR